MRVNKLLHYDIKRYLGKFQGCYITTNQQPFSIVLYGRNCENHCYSIPEGRVITYYVRVHDNAFMGSLT